MQYFRLKEADAGIDPLPCRTGKAAGPVSRSDRAVEEEY
jgi:hypothetical protein